ncbi:MAG TPA: hypothetical protein VKU92_02845, partial [Acidimicrobiales bacterium]|nr:hypothetical protein [Acidimicrobiales bacterium]
TGERRAAGHVPALLGHISVVCLLAAAAVAMFARVWITGHPTTTVLCQCGDPGQAVWFVAWVPYALAHLHNPLFTTRMLAGPGGANLLESTSYLLPAFVVSPVTALFGANVGFNVAETLGPVVSGWATYWATGRPSASWLPRAFAAFVAGYSPFLVGSAVYGHLNFTWLYFPALLFLACHEILVGDRLRAGTVGVLLGLLVVAQFFTGTEPLLITALAAVPALTRAFAIGVKSADRTRVRRIVVGFATAACVAGALLAYPLWFVADGPRRVVGVPWPGTTLFGNPVGSILEPGANVHLPPGFTEVGGYFGPSGPNGSYLGVGLLVLLAACVPVLVARRRWTTSPLVVGGGFAWVCSLGVYSMPGFHSPIWFVWRYLSHWPYVDKIAPARFAFIVVTAAALVLALGLDTWAEVIEGSLRKLRAEPKRRSWFWGRAVPGTLLLGTVTAAVVPTVLEYTFPLVMHSDGVPAYFRTTALHLAPSTEVLTYPYASSGVPDAMYWQAFDGLDFALVGGRALVPGADGRHSNHVSPIEGSAGLLTRDSFGVGVPVTPTPHQVESLRASLQHWKVDLVVVVDHGRAPAWALACSLKRWGRSLRLSTERKSSR